MAVAAFISGCAGPELCSEEKRFFATARPWGLILFRRNCLAPEQIRALVDEFRVLVERPDAPVLIDQEGGRVQRLAPPIWPAYPPARRAGALYAREPEAAKRLAWAQGRLMADDLHALGITVDCLPVLDVPQPDGHDVIGDRAYALDVEAVAVLAGAACRGLAEGGVLPVMKHIPGHGRARVDSHLGLPVVEARIEQLRAVDFAPFRAHAALPLAMTAHVVYAAIDADRPATLSERVIAEAIRGWIGFDGLLMSDDLAMGALSGTIAQRTGAAIAAGCDLALHCNGQLAEMREVAAVCGELGGKAAQRAERALQRRGEPQPYDRAAAWDALHAANGESV